MGKKNGSPGFFGSSLSTFGTKGGLLRRRTAQKEESFSVVSGAGGGQSLQGLDDDAIILTSEFMTIGPHEKDDDGVGSTQEEEEDDDDDVVGYTSALIILNWELPFGLDTTSSDQKNNDYERKNNNMVNTWRLIQKASVCVCADGGANRLYDQIPLCFPDEDADEVRKRYLPHIIAGDLDSVRGEVKEYYSRHGVEIVDLSHDQDTTDLMKCIDLLMNFRNWKKPRKDSLRKLHTRLSKRMELYSSVSSVSMSAYDAIVAVGAHGGRLDHILGNLSILYMYRDLPLVLIGENNLTRLVRKGKTVIKPSLLEGPKCGLVPLQGEAVATSSGLRWNLSDTTMVMGGLISSCNEIVVHDDGYMDVHIHTNADLIWTIQLN